MAFLFIFLIPTFRFTYLLEDQMLSPGNTPSPTKKGSNVRDHQILATPSPAPLNKNSKQNFLVYLPPRQCQKGDREEGQLEKTRGGGSVSGFKPSPPTDSKTPTIVPIWTPLVLPLITTFKRPYYMCNLGSVSSAPT